jgi:hypothetical protein
MWDYLWLFFFPFPWLWWLFVTRHVLIKRYLYTFMENLIRIIFLESGIWIHKAQEFSIRIWIDQEFSSSLFEFLLALWELPTILVLATYWYLYGEFDQNFLYHRIIIWLLIFVLRTNGLLTGALLFHLLFCFQVYGNGVVCLDWFINFLFEVHPSETASFPHFIRACLFDKQSTRLGMDTKVTANTHSETPAKSACMQYMFTSVNAYICFLRSDPLIYFVGDICSSPKFSPEGHNFRFASICW